MHPVKWTHDLDAEQSVKPCRLEVFRRKSRPPPAAEEAAPGTVPPFSIEYRAIIATDSRPLGGHGETMGDALRHLHRTLRSLADQVEQQLTEADRE